MGACYLKEESIVVAEHQTLVDSESLLQHARQLVKSLRLHLPIKVRFPKHLDNVFRKQGLELDFTAEHLLLDVEVIDELLGIMCSVEVTTVHKKVMCAITHLQFPHSHPLLEEIMKYQMLRVEQVKQMRRETATTVH